MALVISDRAIDLELKMVCTAWIFAYYFHLLRKNQNAGARNCVTVDAGDRYSFFKKLK